jgi:Mycothiol-dependent nitroreductase Rv2466c
VHNAGRGRSEVREGDLSLIEEAVAAAGLDPSMAAAANNEGFDAVLRGETDIALSRTGKDVGTPIITFAPGTDREASFFGPVIARIPRRAEATELWDAVERLARTEGLYELKRTNREAPDFS